MLSFYLIVFLLILDASLDGLCRGTAGGVHAVSAVVLLVIQEPARVGEASHLDGSVAQLSQQLRHAIHIQQNSGTTRTANRNTAYFHQCIKLVKLEL